MRLRTGVLLLLAFPLAVQAQQRSLHWDSLDVSAQLDADGRLHITERQAIVFDGAWNGGERRFRLGPGQKLDLVSLVRLDGEARRPLRQGSPSDLALDEFAWFDANTLRWRSRRPSDPPFRNTTLVYELAYAVTGAVYREGETWLLDHDFAFPERDGVIETFSLDLEIDPAWRPEIPLAMPVAAGPLRPGEGYVLTIPMARVSETPAAFAQEGRPPDPESASGLHSGEPGDGGLFINLQTPPATLPFKGAALGVVLALAWLGWKMLERHESARRRFEPLPTVSRSWLDRNVFAHRPEVVGAAWDGSTGKAEVAALIAVMSGEGKIRTEYEPEMQLRLVVPRESLTPYERQFVDQFFPAGDVTSQAILKAKYARTGFDPAAAIRSSLEQAARPLVGAGEPLGAMIGCIAAALFFSFFAGSILTISMAMVFGERFGPVGPLLLIALLATFAMTTVYRKMAAPRAMPWYLAIPGLVVAAAGVLVGQTVGSVVFVLAVALAILVGGFQRARSRRTAEQLETLRGFHAARQFLRELLERNDPSIEEWWTPWLLAFDLAPEVDRWNVASPGRVGMRHRSASSGGSGTSAAFAGGGGAFGGAGASGGWASAIGAMASSIASPSRGGSSSSGGRSSGGGGGGRSGGGGGGGW